MDAETRKTEETRFIPLRSSEPISDTTEISANGDLDFCMRQVSTVVHCNGAAALDPENEFEQINRITPVQADGRLTGQFMTLMNMTKANLGTGILALPFAFKNSGLALGVACVVLFGIICTHCMQIIVTASHHFGRLESRNETTLPKTSKRFDYPAVARLAFQHSPLNRWTRAVQHITNGFIIVTQLGFCCIYIVFVARTMENVLHEYSTTVMPINIRYIELMWVPLFLALAMIRNLKRLAPLSTLANIVMFVSLLIVYQHEVRHLPPISTVSLVGTLSGIARFFGTTTYAFACIACVLPVENKMKRPETFGGVFGILNRAMLIVTTMYAVTGFLGYWAYGDLVEGSITYNLPSHNPVYMVTKIAMAVSVYISYAIQLYVPVRIIVPYMQQRFALISNAQQARAEYLLRILLTILTFAMAIFVPYLAEFIGLVGAFGSSYLALILPPVIDLVYRYDAGGAKGLDAVDVVGGNAGSTKAVNYGRFHWRIVKNLAIIAFGLIGFALGTYVALFDIVDKFRETADGGTSSSLMVNDGNSNNTNL